MDQLVKAHGAGVDISHQQLQISLVDIECYM